MKFMKVGSKPDTFYTVETVRSVSSEVSTDIGIEVNGTKFLLHKFPLLSKCGRLQRLAAEARQSKMDKLELHDFPGGAEAFELCAKFCYGITVTISAFNVVASRSAAEYLEMNEEVEKGNLIFKLEVFLNSTIFRCWKDSVTTLKTTKAFMPWSEDLKIVSRCIDAIACKTLVSPSKVDWSYTYTRGHREKEQGTSENSSSPPWNGIQSRRYHPVPKDWWVEDISELEIELYWRVMMAIKSTGKILHEVIGEALRVYAFRWLPGMSKEHIFTESAKGISTSHSTDYVDIAAKHGLLLETIVSLLPPEKGSTSCSCLLKLLRAATILGASPSSKMELARRVGLQLEEASLNDLLIPSLSYANETLYDVDLVQTILEHFMTQNQSLPTSPARTTDAYEKRRTRSAENLDFVESRRSTAATHSAKLKVAKLVDAYLIEIGRDANLPISKFISLAEAIPDFARPVHDDLYKAIDIYLQEHPGFTKSERKKICRLLDCKKLSVEACMHAAQNERLPLRVVVQVLFFEQVRAAMSGGLSANDLPSNIKALLATQESDSQDVAQSSSYEDGWDAVHQNFNSLKGDLANMKVRLAEAEKERHDMQQEVAKSSKSKGLCTFPSKSRRIFSKLWSSNKSVSEKL
eukprot:Gb_32606 [translate_table: standard]